MEENEVVDAIAATATSQMMSYAVSRDAVENALKATITQLEVEHERLVSALRNQLGNVTAENVALKARIAELEGTPTDKPKLGMAAPANLWAVRKAEVEATGGKLEARRIFLTGFNPSLRQIQEAHQENLLPVVSIKPGDWGDVASGKSDAALRTLADNLAALDKPVVVALHHEPDQKSTPADQGEGGTATEFANMYLRAIPILKTAPNVKVAVIMNGWWWGDRGGLTDAQIAVWLPPKLRSMLDVVAADDYSPRSGEPSVVKTKNRVAWAKRMGDVKAVGIGEFNGFVASDLKDVIDYAKTEPLFRNGWLLLWNSTGGTYLPLNDTGLLDDFQAMLKAW